MCGKIINMDWKSLFAKTWKQTFLLAFALFAVSTILSFSFFRTKIQIFVGFPFWFYAQGIFPWLGDLEDKTLFSIGRLISDIAFWYFISIMVLLVKNHLEQKKKV